MYAKSFLIMHSPSWELQSQIRKNGKQPLITMLEPRQRPPSWFLQALQPMYFLGAQGGEFIE